jgi:hypothetical protein
MILNPEASWEGRGPSVTEGFEKENVFELKERNFIPNQT